MTFCLYNINIKAINIELKKRPMLFLLFAYCLKSIEALYIDPYNNNVVHSFDGVPLMYDIRDFVESESLERKEMRKNHSSARKSDGGPLMYDMRDFGEGESLENIVVKGNHPTAKKSDKAEMPRKESEEKLTSCVVKKNPPCFKKKKGVVRETHEIPLKK